MTNQEKIDFPWNTKQTIENLKTLKEVLQKKVISRNLDGKGEKDAEECAYDFNRAIEALERQIPKAADNNVLEKCPNCEIEFGWELINNYKIEYCPYCGQRL